MDNPSRSDNRTGRAYKMLRADILACRLRPGEKLTISDLCSALEVSLGAVREALSRLTSDGLVLLEPNKGFRVAPVTREELEDITHVRCEIEAMCLSAAIANANLKWEAGIVSSLHELSRLPLTAADDPERISEEWTQAHASFHTALVAACPSRWLLRIREILFAQSERYRQFSLPLDSANRNIDGEHRAIADAALAGDGDGACGLLREHLEWTTRILIESGVAGLRDA